MLSLDMAKRLKEAGLVWEPQEHDWYTLIDAPWLEGHAISLRDVNVEGAIRWANDERVIWLPRLDQLLNEIERREYRYMLHGLSNGKYCVQLCARNILNDLIWGDGFYADTPGDAAAQAVEWILQRGVE